MKIKNKPILLFTIVLLCAFSLKAQTTTENCSNPSKRELPSFFYGVTVEHIIPSEGNQSNPFDRIKQSIKSLNVNGKKPFVRIVFQWNKGQPYNHRVNEYRRALCGIRDDAYIIGEILDSEFVKHCNAECYEQRTKVFVETLGNLVDVWEIGNEINGEWLHDKEWFDNTHKKNDRVRRKVNIAFKAVKGIDKNARTALTLYYNDDNNPDEEKRRSCWKNKENEMFSWAKNYVSEDLKKQGGLDYVLLSYYDDPHQCRHKFPDGRKEKLNPNWKDVFLRLSGKDYFPNSKLGFGEIGTIDAQQKSSYIENYYGSLTKELKSPNYVGGYFWWYFGDEITSTELPVEKNPFLQKMREVIASNPN